MLAMGSWDARVTKTEVVQQAQDLLGYEFNDPELLRQALTHASVADSRLASNERLEFLGDSVLAIVVCEELFERFPEFLEGELTKLKSVIVSRKTCARMADQLELTPMLFLGKGMTNREPVPTSLRAAVLESVIAGIFLDGGFEPAKNFILRVAGPFIDEAANSESEQNHKSLLQQHAQKCFSATPQYIQLDEQGPDHSKCFEVCVAIGNTRFAAAWGPSKKEAEQRAARHALDELIDTDTDLDPAATLSGESSDVPDG